MTIESIAKAFKGARKHLAENPGDGNCTDTFASAKLVQGLRMQVTGPTGQAVRTDMPAGVGGEASAPSPGWLMRAATAACTSTVIVLRAADLGVTLDSVEVKVESQSNDCGLFGVGNDIPAGPLSASMEVRISAMGVDETVLNDIVAWAVAHSPVADALQRTVPLTVATTVN
jgi:uncharacterized OsmC-like protein